MKMSEVIYLTGSSGFIGQMIVQLADKDDSISKVYCPIRTKYGSKGQDRFDELFGTSKKACFIDTESALPDDTTILILNAYSVKFLNPMIDILKENVLPMLHLLDQCRKPDTKVRGIAVVSTAYVQLPRPYERDPKNRIEFALRHHASACKIMEDIISGASSEEKIMSLLDDNAKAHYKTNNYALSKHLMEHVIHEKYSDLPLCIVRPSIVSPSRDGLHGHGIKSGFSLFMDIARQPIMRFPRNEGRLDLVYVEDVSKDILRGATEVAAKAEPKSDSGTLFHPIVSSTSLSNTDPIECFRLGAPTVRRFDVRNATLRNMLRNLEISTIRLIAGKKSANLVKRIYTNFDPIMKNRWDFEESIPWSHPEDMIEKYYKRRETMNGTTESSSQGSRWLQGDAVVAFLLAVSLFFNVEYSAELQLIRLFLLLRLSVLLGMQAIFYGNTAVRNGFPYTINDKQYDSRQHDREETSWPSVLLSGLEFYVVYQLGLLPSPTTIPFFTWTSLGLVVLTHVLPVEFIYYWAHRWMHEYPSLYKVHKHHHLSIVPTPKTSVTFLWSEHIFYDLLFALPVLVPAFLGHATIVSTLFYVPVFDFLNTLGHTNLEIFPSWYMNSPFYYFFYCTTYHHVHHRYFKYNYALFMPIYDMVFGSYSHKFTEADFNAAKRKAAI